jgi:hypothetical protein
MKQGTLPAIMATLMTELPAAIHAAEKADAENYSAMDNAIASAIDDYSEALNAVDDKRRAAAELIAESLDMAKAAKEQLDESMRTARRDFAAASGEKLAGVKSLKLISSKKVA